MVVIDCGACVGSFFRQFLEHEIHAFEPLQKNFAYLKKRYPQVRVYRKAVTGKSGETVKLYLHQDVKHRNRLGSMGSSVMADKTNVDKAHFEEVESLALSDFLGDLGKRVNLLKIDTEGTEFQIFEDLLRNGRINDFDLIVYEDHRQRHPAMFDLPWTNEVEKWLAADFKGELRKVDF